MDSKKSGHGINIWTDSKPAQGKEGQRAGALPWEGGRMAARRSSCHFSSGMDSAAEMIEQFDKSLDILASWEIKMKKCAGKLRLNHSLAFLKQGGIAIQTAQPGRSEQEPRQGNYGVSTTAAL